MVVYKGRAARVRHSGKSLEIERQTGEILTVRPKDVLLVHPGPIRDFLELSLLPDQGEFETAWGLVAGSTTDVAELAELAFGIYSPATAWATWKWIADGVYFRGTPQEVVPRSAEEVAREQTVRQARASEEQAWSAFVGRLQSHQVLDQDSHYLREVEDLALGRRDRSRVLRELGRTESPENAHALLLEVGRWDYAVDPYPQRLGLSASPATVDVPELPVEDRLDLSHLRAYAVDEEGNRDPDDALSLDGRRLWVHVADVAGLVRPDSPLDIEARARGASLYLPEGTVPMLPTAAVQMLGLGLAERSPALSFGLDVGDAGQIEGIEVVPSWVHVTRLTYEEAEARLETEPLHSLYALAHRNLSRRQAQGAVFIDLPEVKIWVADGHVGIRPVLPLRSRDLVTEAMIMAGEATARFALEQGIPLPFTTQEPAATDDRPGAPPSLSFKAGDLASMFALRQHLRPSQYSTVPGQHAGLGLAAYVQTTSPLRRYLDLVVHQQLRAHLRGEEVLDLPALLERVGATMAVMGTVRQAERLARRHWTLVYMMQHSDWQGEGIVVEKRERRATVLIPSLDLEVQVHLRSDIPLNSSVALGRPSVDLPDLSIALRVIDQ